MLGDNLIKRCFSTSSEKFVWWSIVDHSGNLSEFSQQCRGSMEHPVLHSDIRGVHPRSVFNIDIVLGLYSILECIRLLLFSLINQLF